LANHDGQILLALSEGIVKKPSSLRVVSYNIHKGFTFGNRRFVLQEIRDALRAIRPDVVFLQEVIGNHTKHALRHEDWPEQSQSEYLADDFLSHEIYAKNAVYSDGHHGNAILSRFPLHHTRNVDVSTNRFEQRGLLATTADVEGQNVALFCCHLNLLERDRRRQAETMSQLINHTHDPLILAGDFNDWRRNVGRGLEQQLDLDEAHFSVHGRYARSFPSWYPLLELDRIYLRGCRAETARCLVEPPWSRLSDHALLIADLEIV
jgi:endonuclease/exonuclease/phosphatase family metal-dependent hydrolase